MFSDPRFIPADTDAAKAKIIADLNTKVPQVRSLLPQWFGTLPKADVEIRRVPKNIEAAQPLWLLQRPVAGWEAPRHLLDQSARHRRKRRTGRCPASPIMKAFPAIICRSRCSRKPACRLIRKVASFSAYIEGWALYAEQLAVEMGMYSHDPLGEIGQLHDSMLRGIRLVVDSGMHAMKWSREQAVRYFADNAGDPDSAVITEVERYCVWPGQACSYMLGKLEFLSRARAGAEGAGRQIRHPQIP